MNILGERRSVILYFFAFFLPFVDLQSSLFKNQTALALLIRMIHLIIGDPIFKEYLLYASLPLF